MPRVSPNTGLRSRLAPSVPRPSLIRTESRLAFRPWIFPNAAYHHTLTTARLNLRSRRKNRLLGAMPRLPLTTRSIVDDTLALCRTPLAKTKSKTSSAHAKNRSSLLSVARRLHADALQPLSCRLDTPIRGWQQNHHLHSRPEGGAGGYDQLRPVHVEGRLGFSGSAHAEERSPPPSEQEESLCDAEFEIAGLRAFYTFLIAAARHSLTPIIAAGLIRRLRTERTIAIRAAKDRRHSRRHNLRQARNAAGPPQNVSYPTQQCG